MKERRELITGLFLFFLYIVLSFLVKFNLFNDLDLSTTTFLQQNITQALNIPFSILSLVGSLEFAIMFFFVLWAVYKKMNYLFILLFFGFFHFIEFIGKYFINHPGPDPKFFRYDIPFSFPSSSVSPGFSYPSGHMGRTAFISVVIFYIILDNKYISKEKKKIYLTLILLFNLLMFASRIYLGEHWLSDVIGGGVLGLSFGFIFFYWQTRSRS